MTKLTDECLTSVVYEQPHRASAHRTSDEQ